MQPDQFSSHLVQDSDGAVDGQVEACEIVVVLLGQHHVQHVPVRQVPVRQVPVRQVPVRQVPVRHVHH
ncbi:hypothetical protein [Nonomuraea fuscirosea]|uniref:hypothetical protein n=1 Tax=Nonomuraea fuscirosea TaxID=1291556 RepID=UPI0034147FC6